MSQRLHGWERKPSRVHTSPSRGPHARTRTPCTRSRACFGCIDESAPRRLRRARVEQAAFDYAYTHKHAHVDITREDASRSSRESHRVAFVELAVLETGNSPFNERVSITRFSPVVSVFLETFNIVNTERGINRRGEAFLPVSRYFYSNNLSTCPRSIRQRSTASTLISGWHPERKLARAHAHSGCAGVYRAMGRVGGVGWSWTVTTTRYIATAKPC